MALNGNFSANRILAIKVFHFGEKMWRKKNDKMGFFFITQTENVQGGKHLFTHLRQLYNDLYWLGNMITLKWGKFERFWKI